VTCVSGIADKNKKEYKHLLMGGHAIPYNNGNGVVVKYFSEDGGENDTYSTRFPEICMAGKPIGDE
jgi:hypothetical protein